MYGGRRWNEDEPRWPRVGRRGRVQEVAEHWEWSHEHLWKWYLSLNNSFFIIKIEAALNGVLTLGQGHRRNVGPAKCHWCSSYPPNNLQKPEHASWSLHVGQRLARSPTGIITSVIGKKLMSLNGPEIVCISWALFDTSEGVSSHHIWRFIEPFYFDAFCKSESLLRLFWTHRIVLRSCKMVIASQKTYRSGIWTCNWRNEVVQAGRSTFLNTI